MLSYTSILGILSTLFLVVVVVADGLTKKDAPGSLYEPAATSVGPASAEQLGIAFGLFMAGVSILSMSHDTDVSRLRCSSLAMQSYLPLLEIWLGLNSSII